MAIILAHLRVWLLAVSQFALDTIRPRTRAHYWKKMASKIQERIYLEWFLKQESITFTNIQEHENPDFLIQIGSRVTGVEITNLYLESSPGKKGSKIKAVESARTKWLLALAVSYYKQHSTPIRLNLWTNSPLSEELSGEILSALGASSQLPLFKRVRIDIKLPPGSRCVADVTRLPAKFSAYSRWTFLNDHISFVGDITREHILHALNKKSRRVADYLRCCDRVWLLLVADSSWNSGSFQIPNQLPIVVPSGFVKIWLLDYSETVHLIS